MDNPQPDFWDFDGPDSPEDPEKKLFQVQWRAMEALDRGDTAEALRIVTGPPYLGEYEVLEQAIATRQYEVFKAILDRQPNVAKWAGEEGLSDNLILASVAGHLGMVRDLVAAGADVNRSDFDFVDHDHINGKPIPRRYNLFTALEGALDAGHRDVADFLAPLTHPWLRDRSGPDKSGLEADYFLFLAADANRHDISRWAGNSFDQCPEEYRQAAEAGRLELARVALARGADVRAWFDHERNTALHIAAEEGDEELARLLLEAGADTETRARDGATPLWRAVEQAEIRLVELLLAAGANAEAKLDGEDKTPLWRAVVWNHLPLARALLGGGARADTRDVLAAERTPLMHAARRVRHEMAALLLEFGADPSAVDWEGVSVLDHVRDRPGSEALKHLLRSKGEDDRPM